MLKINSFLILLISVLITGCVTRHGKFTVISNKLIRLNDFELDDSDRKEYVAGSDKQHILIFFPLSGPPNLGGAIDDALEKGGGDVMTDATVKSWGWYIPYIYGQTGWSIKGDVVKTRKPEQKRAKKTVVKSPKSTKKKVKPVKEVSKKQKQTVIYAKQGTIEERLKQVDTLFRIGVISEEEHARKRKEILDEL